MVENGSHKRSGLLSNSTQAAQESEPAAPPKSAYVERMQSIAKAKTKVHTVAAQTSRSNDAAGPSDMPRALPLVPALDAHSRIVSPMDEPSTQHVGQLKMLRIASIKKSPYQPRVRLDQNHVAEIAESIRVDKLNDPITVRPYTPEANDNPLWQYELVAGENRLEGFKLNGEELIPAIVKQYDDFQAARMAVFSNKKRKDMAPYEEFLGYQMLLEMGAVKSQNQMAIDAELSKTEMSRLMSFRKLPKPAHELLAQQPTLIGSNAAETLASFAERADYETLTMEALGMIAAGEVDQSKVGLWIEQRDKPKESRASGGEKLLITDQGGRTYASLKRDAKGFKIGLGTDVDQVELEQALLKFLVDRAQAAGSA